MNVRRMQDKRFWVKGEPLTEKDKILLQIVKELADDLGYTPLKRDCKQSSKIKSRFRSWNDVIFACGLPSINSPEQIALRKTANKNV